MADNQQTDEMREAFGCEIRLESVGMTHDIYQVVVPRGQIPIIVTTRYEAALRNVSELIGLAKNTGSESYLEKALATIDKLLGGK